MNVEYPILRKGTQGSDVSQIESGVLQIGIRAWLLHLICLGSWMSLLKTIFKGILRVTPYINYFLKSLVKILLKKRMKLSIVCVFKKYELCIVHELIDRWLTIIVLSTLKQSVNRGKTTSIKDGDTPSSGLWLPQ
jgi:hypothetical protein